MCAEPRDPNVIGTGVLKGKETWLWGTGDLFANVSKSLWSLTPGGIRIVNEVSTSGTWIRQKL